MTELLDTSVWTLAARDPEVSAEVVEALGRNGVATCDPVRFELLYAARSIDEFRFVRERLGAVRHCPVDQGVWDRALDVYELLAAQGGAHQRQVSHPDLLVAAAAERAGVPVLHYDEDYDRIAAVTGQATRWVRPRGSL
jgi:predicted nucleic acid-binding protein